MIIIKINNTVVLLANDTRLAEHEILAPSRSRFPVPSRRRSSARFRHPALSTVGSRHGSVKVSLTRTIHESITVPVALGRTAPRGRINFEIAPAPSAPQPLSPSALTPTAVTDITPRRVLSSPENIIYTRSAAKGKKNRHCVLDIIVRFPNERADVPEETKTRNVVGTRRRSFLYGSPPSHPPHSNYKTLVSPISGSRPKRVFTKSVTSCGQLF